MMMMMMMMMIINIRMKQKAFLRCFLTQDGFLVG